MIKDEIMRSYRLTKSMRRTAAELHVSQGTVRKVLIGAGVLTSPLIKRIAELRALGMPDKDIADLLHVSTSTVCANSSYDRGTYLDNNKSHNAIIIARCRARKEGEEK